MTKTNKGGDKNKTILMIGLLVLIVAAFGGLLWFIQSGGKSKGASTKKERQIDFNIVDNEDKLVKTRFLNKTEEELRRSTQKSKQVLSEMEVLKKSIKQMKEQMRREKTKGGAGKVNTQNLPTPAKKDFSDIFSKFPNGLPQVNDKKDTTSLQNPFKKKEEIYYEYEEVESSLELDVVEDDKKSNLVTEKGNKKSNIPSDAFFIPAGSVTVAYLEQGYDAPTLKNGKGDLVPSTLTIVGYTLLPNNKLYDLRGCKVLAEAEGKRSNERSYSRTKRLACIDDDNRPMDIPLSGYISDEGGDGKLGLKGNIVSMQNKFLQNAVWIGIVEGLASIGKATSMTQSATAQGGIVSTINAGDEFKAGLAGSVGETTSSIKEFLMDNVKSIEPVIEIKGGRLVAVTLSEGIYIYPRLEYQGNGGKR